MPVIARLRKPRPPRRRGRRRLRTVATLPTMLTLGNLICGFAAIHFCMRAMLVIANPGDAAVGLPLSEATAERLLPSFLSIAAGLVFLGLLLDALDGSVARWTHRTSDFGGQLDSLADVVTFGIAPAMLVVSVLMGHRDVTVLPGPLASNLAGRAMWFMAAVYVGCTALRLARFNVEHARANSDHNYFSGLPSPGGAVVLASLTWLHQDVSAVVQPYLALAMPFVALGLGLLMVSRVRYTHMANVYLRGRRPFGQVVALMVFAAVLVWYKELTLAIVVCLYAASGPVAVLSRRLAHASPDVPQKDKAADRTQPAATAQDERSA
ncbi:MAG: CDP-alcohol phosphatidyltransferase family protein [Planctomycetes bacterium]|nr:CDP-alcohol phosphatidyltransferase family protein [Planctomycetota bacterium]